MPQYSLGGTESVGDAFMSLEAAVQEVFIDSVNTLDD